MKRALLFVTCLISLCGTLPPLAVAQSQPGPYQRYGRTELGQYRVGVSITARQGAVQNIVAMVAVPLECDEQTVQIVDEDITVHCSDVDYRLLREGGARQLLVRIPYLPAHEKAHAIITFDVGTNTILPPTKTDQLTIPTKPSKQLKQYLGRSPYIETGNSKLKKISREIFATLENQLQSAEPAPTQTPSAAGATTENSLLAGPPAESAAPELPSTPRPTAWQRVEAIYDWVLAHVTYVEGDDQSALQTLRAGQGDCHDVSALFIALCRTNKIPARVVWVHQHSYAEFCLVDPDGAPHWFPVESAGTRAFGEMPLARTILQKGDRFIIPEKPRHALRYASNFLVAEGTPGAGKPRVRYIQDQL